MIIVNPHSCAVDVNIPVFQNIGNLKRSGNWLRESKKEAVGLEFTGGLTPGPGALEQMQLGDEV